MEGSGLHFEFMKVMHRIKRGGGTIAIGNLSRMEFFTLEVLHNTAKKKDHAGGVSASELAAMLHMSGPAVSRMLRSLEEGGLIERSIDLEDRRNIVIRLTEKGEVTRDKTHEQMREMMDRAIEKMGTENMRTLLDLFARLADIMEEEIKLSQEGERECEN